MPPKSRSADEPRQDRDRDRTESGVEPQSREPSAALADGSPAVLEPRSKTEADEVTGPTPNPGNESDLSGLVAHHPLRAESLSTEGRGEVVAPVTEKADSSEKIGRIPGETSTISATSTYKYQHVILPVGPQGDVLPGPDSAAIQACIQAGYRPVAEAKVESVLDHPDGVSKVVTWAIPCVEASSDEYRHEGVNS